MSDNEKDARYMLENMMGNVIMVMGKGREWGGGGGDGVRRILYVGDLDFKANGNEVGRLARHTIALSYRMTNGEQRETETAVGRNVIVHITKIMFQGA